MLHQRTRKKNLVEAVANMNTGETYPRILQLETQIAKAVIQRMEMTAGACIPPFAIKGQSVYFAIDHVDFLEDTSTGKDTLYGTAMVMYQQEVPGTLSMLPPLDLNVPSNQISFGEPLKLDILPCPSPKLTPILQPNFKLGQHQIFPKTRKLDDLVWVVGCQYHFMEPVVCSSGFDNHDDNSGGELNLPEIPNTDPVLPTEEGHGGLGHTSVPTWAAYNSLISDQRQKTNVGVDAPPQIGLVSILLSKECNTSVLQ